MLGSALKIDGRFILQTQSDGPVRMLVVDFTTPGKVRACARFDKDRVAAAIAAGKADAGALLGKGHLAMTIDQGPDMSRYQGLVALDGGSLEDAAHEYFLRSEQIPTRVRLAVAEELRAGEGGASHRWRAGGIMLQFLPKSPERARVADLHPGDAPEGMELHAVPEDDAWVEGRALVSTVEDVELIDPALSSERLVYRLFHEPGVRVFRGGDVRAQCSCSRDSVEAMLQELLAGRPRPHGRGRQDFGDLRILQRELCVRAGRGRGQGELAVRSSLDLQIGAPRCERCDNFYWRSSRCSPCRRRRRKAVRSRSPRRSGWCWLSPTR